MVTWAKPDCVRRSDSSAVVKTKKKKIEFTVKYRQPINMAIEYPIITTFFLPIRSANFPENGLEIAAAMVKKVIINPLKDAPPNSEIKSFN